MAASDRLRESIVDRIAAQWIALGGQLSGSSEETVVDLEGLIAITAALTKGEPRVRGVALDWCIGFGAVINSSRLKRVASEIGVDLDHLGEFGGAVTSGGGPRWSSPHR